MNKRKGIHIACIVAASALWGMIGLYTTPLNAAGIASTTLTTVRSILTALCMGLFILIKDRSRFRIRLRDLWIFFGMGVVSYSLFSIGYFYSIQINQSLSTACILLYTSPIFVMLMSLLLFRERITRGKLCALALAVAGCMLVAGRSSGISPLGLLIGLGSGFGYALYSIFTTYALRKYHFTTSIFYAFLCSSVVLTPFVNWQSLFGTLCLAPGLVWPLLAISILATFVPYLLYTKGMEQVEASRAAILACVEPLVATLVGLLAFSQPVTLISGLGIVCILVAGVLCARA